MNLASKSVVVAESDPVLLERICFRLSKEGYQVFSATDGRCAFDLVNANNPVLLVTALSLPGLDGNTLIKALRSDPQFACMPILLLAESWEAHGYARDSGDLLQHGSLVVLPKPFHMREITGLVRVLVEAPRICESTSRVLIVDDDEICRRLCAHYLELEDISFEYANSAEQARRFLKQQRFDLILMEVVLPDGNGFELMAELRGLAKETPIIIMTAHGSEKIAVQAWAEGASRYLIKPFEYEGFAAAVQETLMRVKHATVQAVPLPAQPDRSNAEPNSVDLSLVESLTSRELEVMELMTKGLGSKKVAALLSISEKTIGNHLSRIYEKLQVSNRTQAVILFLQSRILAN